MTLFHRHTSRFLILWLAVLPLVVTNVAGAATIPACTLIATLLLATDEVGVQVEEPFSVLPLEVRGSPLAHRWVTSCCTCVFSQRVCAGSVPPRVLFLRVTCQCVATTITMHPCRPSAQRLQPT